MTPRFAGRMDRVQPSAIRDWLALGADPSIISFGGGYPDASLFPAGQLEAVFREVILAPGGGAMQYAPSDGLPRLREQIAGLMTQDSTPCRAEDVLILQGSQQGLDFAARMLIDPGDVIVTEDPTFLGALIAFNPDFTQVSAGGAEVSAGFKGWLIKFQIDPEDHLCRQEHALSLMAAAAGIRVPDTRLFQTPEGAAHFMTRRFDLNGNAPIHLHSYAGLTHTPMRDLIDYSDLLDLTRELTARESEVDEMFRRAVFNIAIANDDDHSRNHAFLMDASGEWMLSPAYDITRSGYALGSGFRAAGVRGKFSGITPDDMSALAAAHGLRRVEEKIEAVLGAIRLWPSFAEQAGLRDSEAALLQDEFPAGRW